MIIKEFAKLIFRLPEYDKEKKIKSLKKLYAHYFYIGFIIILTPIHFVLSIINKSKDISIVTIITIYLVSIILATLMFKFSVVRSFIKSKRSNNSR